MAASTLAPALTVTGKGLITGKPVSVDIQRAEPGHGVVFYIEGASPIPARLEAVVHTDRGVTLANRDGKTLSIVEHFLCAAAMAGLSDLRVSVSGAPELPILDGSARDWLNRFAGHFAEVGDSLGPETRNGLGTESGNVHGTEIGSGHATESGTLAVPMIDLPAAVFYRHPDDTNDICLYAVPDTHFKITYSVDFDHPDLACRWIRWDSRQDNFRLIADAGTFGYVDELPALQARGLALGAGPENSLGLTGDGGYSRPLRHDDEPIYHKALDLIGDLSLSGINPLSLKAHVFAINAGHGSHIAFAKKLLPALSR